MLRMLECYVLKAIEALQPTDAHHLTAMQPQLSQIYDSQGTWDQIIASAMRLPENMPELIQKMWKKNQAIAATNGLELPPQQFAEMFVDQNLGPEMKKTPGKNGT